MNKFLIAAAVALFMGNSTASYGESTAEMALKQKSAQQILNEMVCKDKEPSARVKDQTDGSIFTCVELNVAKGEVETHSIQYGDKRVEDL
jgi:hypothetical protein